MEDMELKERELTIDSFQPRVPRAIQLEGVGFELHGRVGIVARRTNRVHAVIRSRRPYDVQVAITESGKVAVSCDCVTFRDESSVCRHVWAALIKIQNEDLLRLPEATTAVP